MPEISKIENRGTDRDRAANLKEEICDALLPVIGLIQQAKDEGFIVTFNIGDGPMGKTTLTALFIDRRY